jgi:hypothetical protein
MIGKTSQSDTVYYFCRQAKTDACSSRKTALESRIYGSVVDIMRTFVEPQAVDAYIEKTSSDSLVILEQDVLAVTSALQGIGTRKARWDEAYESQVIDLTTYGTKLGELRTEEEELRARLDRLQTSLAARRDQADLRKRLLQNADQFPAITAENRPKIKQRLRLVVKKIVITEGNMTQIDFY